jgi:hypothetical protein
MSEIRTISEEGANFKLREGEIVGKEYPAHEAKIAQQKMINKKYAYPNMGWRTHTLSNGNVLLLVRKKR